MSRQNPKSVNNNNQNKMSPVELITPTTTTSQYFHIVEAQEKDLNQILWLWYSYQRGYGEMS